MIALGYPGEITSDTGPRLLWGTLSTIPFIYLLYVLFVELSKSLDRQPEQVRGTVSKLRIMLVGLWGVYPIAYLFPVFGFDGATPFVPGRPATRSRTSWPRPRSVWSSTRSPGSRARSTTPATGTRGASTTRWTRCRPRPRSARVRA